MKRLIGLPLDLRQEEEIVRLLTDAGIAYRVARSPFSFLGADAIWVADEDYPRARALVEIEAKAFESMARSEWNAEWITEHKGSANVLQALLLIALVALMLLYPLAYVL